MRDPTRDIAPTSITIRRLSALDATNLEEHCLRLEPQDALNLFSAQAEPVAVRRYIAAIDFKRDIVLAAIDAGDLVRATLRICADFGSRWGELLLARERDHVEAQHWNQMISTAVEIARKASIGWLSVASLGYDPETRDALKGVGFDLQADEGGTIGELRLDRAWHQNSPE